MVDDFNDRGFVGGVELVGVDVDWGVEGCEFCFVGGEVGGVKVVDVDCVGVVLGELVGWGVVDVEEGVGVWEVC